MPLITDDARHGELHHKTGPGPDPPEAKPQATIELDEFKRRAQGGCSSLGIRGDLGVLFRNGGDLGGFERNGWVQMPCPMVIDSGAAETVWPS